MLLKGATNGGRIVILQQGDKLVYVCMIETKLIK